jgi:hypothetical protein
MRLKKGFIYFFFLTQFLLAGAQEPLYFCTGASSDYFNLLLNLIGSIYKVHEKNFGEIVVFDLGLTSEQLEVLKNIASVRICTIEKTHPQILDSFVLANGYVKLGFYAWKPVAIKQALALYPYVLWVDAGTSVLRPLDDLFTYIKQKGYFLATIGSDEPGKEPLHTSGKSATKKVWDFFTLSSPEKAEILQKDSVMANTIGISRGYESVFLNEWYQLSYHLEYFEDDGSSPNGPGGGRHDQTLLTLISYKNKAQVLHQDYHSVHPMKLDLANNCVKDFYMTWHGWYVRSGVTHIYSSRGYPYQDFTPYIRYKK